jgi:excisionase family DNA binding protein
MNITFSNEDNSLSTRISLRSDSMNTPAKNMRELNRNNPEKSMSTGPRHIEVKDIASYCMVSTSTVRRWLKDGKLKAIRLPSNQYRINITDFKDFLKRYDIPVREDFFHRLQSPS